MKTDLKISYPGSEKVYLEGAIYPDIRVAMRRVRQMPTVTIKEGERVECHNPDVYIYDTSGVYGDPGVEVDLKRGLPHLRKEWIRQRAESSGPNISQM
jgi:phosphomethylpyrimidine synthase